jgi:hypothetical protein
VQCPKNLPLVVDRLAVLAQPELILEILLGLVAVEVAALEAKQWRLPQVGHKKCYSLQEKEMETCPESWIVSML